MFFSADSKKIVYSLGGVYSCEGRPCVCVFVRPPVLFFDHLFSDTLRIPHQFHEPPGVRDRDNLARAKRGASRSSRAQFVYGLAFICPPSPGYTSSGGMFMPHPRSRTTVARECGARVVHGQISRQFHPLPKNRTEGISLLTVLAPAAPL